MAKFIKIISMVLFLALLGVYFFAGTIIKTPLESIGSEVLGASVKVNSINISPFSGKVNISGFVIGNPKGFTSKEAFKLSNINVEMDLLSAFSDTIIINKIEIIEPVVTYEISLKGSNLGVIKSNVSSAATSDSQAQEVTPREGGGKKIVIENLIIKGTKLEFVAGGVGIAPSIPDIHLTDIGKKEKGVTAREAAMQIVSGINEVVADVDFGGVENLMKGGKKQLDNLKNKLQGLF